MVRDTCRYFSGLMYRSNAHALKPWQPVSSKTRLLLSTIKKKKPIKITAFMIYCLNSRSLLFEQAIPESKNQGTAMIVEAPSTAQPAASEPASVSTDDTTDSTAAIPSTTKLYFTSSKLY